MGVGAPRPAPAGRLPPLAVTDRSRSGVCDGTFPSAGILSVTYLPPRGDMARYSVTALSWRITSRGILGIPTPRGEDTGARLQPPPPGADAYGMTFSEWARQSLAFLRTRRPVVTVTTYGARDAVVVASDPTRYVRVRY